MEEIENTFPGKPVASVKDLVVTFVLMSALWFASLTFLSPFFLLLVFCSKLRYKFFSILYIMTDVNRRWPRLMDVRKVLFDHIRKEFRTPGRNKTPLRFLEMGVGPGANFRMYREGDTVTLLDLNPNFQSALELELKKYPDVKVDRFIIGRTENMKGVEDNEYDVVVCSYLFCSVSDTMKAMKEAKRVLKPGGKLAFMEHIGYPKDHLAYWIQRALSPIWSVYCNGCRLDRDWKEELNKVFSGVSYEVFYPVFMPMVLRPHAIVVATK